MNDLKFTTASDYMNTDTKFDDLMYRAGLTAQGCWDEMDEYDRNAIQKFAELIVQECVAICVSNALDDLDADNPRGASAKCAFDIKEHFGVEE